MKKKKQLSPLTPFSPSPLENSVLFTWFIWFVLVFQGFYDLLIAVVAECGALLQVQFRTKNRYERLCPKAFVIFNQPGTFSGDRTRYTASHREGNRPCGRLPSPNRWFQEPFERGEEKGQAGSYHSGHKSKNEREHRSQRGWGGGGSPCVPILACDPLFESFFVCEWLKVRNVFGSSSVSSTVPDMGQAPKR